MNRDAFFDGLRKDLFGGALNQQQVEGVDIFLDYFDENPLPIPYQAYIFATVFHETRRTMQPVAEAFWVKNAEAWRKKNLRYYPWYGRGYVQLTWEDNYKKAEREFGVPFTKDPNLAMVPEHAVKVCAIGMVDGWFARGGKGPGLGHYLDKTTPDYKEARRTVNILDKASKIAGYAKKFERDLRAAYGDDTAVAINDKPLAQSRTMQGAGSAAAGGAAVAVQQTVDIVQGQEGALNSGNIVSIVIALVVVFGALYALYARWDDAGRPNPFARSE